MICFFGQNQFLTQEEIRKELRSILVYRSKKAEALPEREIESLLRSYLNLAELNLVLHQFSPGFLGEGVENMFEEEMERSVLGKAMAQDDPLMIKDFSTEASSSFIDQGLLMKGVRSLLLAAVKNEDTQKVVGIFQLTHPEPGSFNREILQELEEIFLMISFYLCRKQEEKEYQIHLMMQEYFTSIHPSVMWKFRAAAIQLFARKKKGTLLEKGIPAVIFPTPLPACQN